MFIHTRTLLNSERVMCGHSTIIQWEKMSNEAAVDSSCSMTFHIHHVLQGAIEKDTDLKNTKIINRAPSSSVNYQDLEN